MQEQNQNLPPEEAARPNGTPQPQRPSENTENKENTAADAAPVQEKKAKRRKKNRRGRRADNALGTSKGVETMFRNAVRSEMELLALAATKANIMISLNGFIVSALMISGAFVFSS